MASEIICKHCGFPNSADSVNCEICDEPLAQPQPAPQATAQQAAAPAAPAAAPAAPGREYFVICPESNHRTVVASESQTRYFCAGCGREHEIDGFIWVVESAEMAAPAPQTAPRQEVKQNRLTLEELNTRQRIEIAPQGGTLGRYGDFGADFFQRNNLLYVSGIHCAFRQQYGSWVVQHMSRTNQTKYDGQILDHDQVYLLENGKTLTLANCVSFVVHID